jgi:sodium transport system permease protein
VRGHNVWIIFRKELLDTLRDRRTIIMMIVVPILIMPLLMIGVSKLTAAQFVNAEKKNSRVVLLGVENAPDFAKKFFDAKGRYKIDLMSVPEWQKAIREDELDAVVEIPAGFHEKIASGESSSIKVHFESTEIASQLALKKIGMIVKDYRAEVLRARGINPDLLEPVRIDENNVAPEGKQKAQIAAMMIPFLLIFLCLMGAYYVAIDLTAGERERGTLETLLVCPAARLEIILGKIITVFGASMTSGILSLVSMALTQAIFGSEMKTPIPTVSMEVPLRITPILLALMVPLATLFSSLMIALSLFARSYKEAMTYISPLLLLEVIPTLLPMLQNSKPGLLVALIPLANASAAMSEVLKGQFAWDFLAITFGSLTVVAVLSVMLAVNLFSRERVLFRT